MAKKRRPKSIVKSKPKMTARPQATFPDYYHKFHCIGPDCEDSCCIGWKVPIDRVTWLRYQACQHETLAPLLRSHVILGNENSPQSEQAYAYIKMQADLRCPFLQSDMLCMIQKELGPEALSDTCAMFPRFHNLFGAQHEYALGISCPEAARLVLLHPEPIGLIMAAPDADLGARNFIGYRVPQIGISDPDQISVMNDLRSLIIYILQFRELTLGARMMLLGSLLDDVDRVISNPSFKNVAEILPVLSSFSTLFVEPSFIEEQFEQVPIDLPRKLHAITAFLAEFLRHADPRFAECLRAGVNGLVGNEASHLDVGAELLARYHNAYDSYYLPYFRDKGYILENYLVNDVFSQLFPFIHGSFLDLYRKMVFNLSIIQVFMVGMAGHYQGLTDMRVVQLIQSFARRTAHDSSYLGKLTEAVASKEAPSFAGLMWMLKER